MTPDSPLFFFISHLDSGSRHAHGASRRDPVEEVLLDGVVVQGAVDVDGADRRVVDARAAQQLLLERTREGGEEEL